MQLQPQSTLERAERTLSDRAGDDMSARAFTVPRESFGLIKQFGFCVTSLSTTCCDMGKLVCWKKKARAKGFASGNPKGHFYSEPFMEGKGYSKVNLGAEGKLSSYKLLNLLFV